MEKALAVIALVILAIFGTYKLVLFILADSMEPKPKNALDYFNFQKELDQLEQSL